MNNVVEVRGLHKAFGKSVAVNDLSFEVHQGEILGFLGANGAGKNDDALYASWAGDTNTWFYRSLWHHDGAKSRRHLAAAQLRPLPISSCHTIFR